MKNFEIGEELTSEQLNSIRGGVGSPVLVLGTPTGASGAGGECVTFQGISGCMTWTSDTNYGNGQMSYSHFQWAIPGGC